MRANKQAPLSFGVTFHWSIKRPEQSFGAFLSILTNP